MIRWEIYLDATGTWATSTLEMAIIWMIGGGEVRCSDV